MLGSLPPGIRARTYAAADGTAAWRATDVPAVLDHAREIGLEPRWVEAWMVFEDGDFAGTHCTVIYIDEGRSSIHRMQLDGVPDPWRVIRSFVTDCAAPREVHPSYKDAIRFHIAFAEKA